MNIQAGSLSQLAVDAACQLEDQLELVASGKCESALCDMSVWLHAT